MSTQGTGEGSIYRRAIPYMAPILRSRWSMLVVAAVVLLASVGAELFKPWPIKLVIDYVLKDRSFLPDWACVAGLGDAAQMLVVLCLLTWRPASRPSAPT